MNVKKLERAIRLGWYSVVFISLGVILITTPTLSKERIFVVVGSALTLSGVTTSLIAGYLSIEGYLES